MMPKPRRIVAINHIKTRLHTEDFLQSSNIYSAEFSPCQTPIPPSPHSENSTDIVTTYPNDYLYPLKIPSDSDSQWFGESRSAEALVRNPFPNHFRDGETSAPLLIGFIEAIELSIDDRNHSPVTPSPILANEDLQSAATEIYSSIDVIRIEALPFINKDVSSPASIKRPKAPNFSERRNESFTAY